MNREKLFVYGTLRTSERANDLLGEDAQLLRPAKTLPIYSLYQIDWYPGLVENGRTAVVGELWEINSSEWSRLDEYEGVPEDYIRKIIELSDGSHAQAYIFIGPIGTAKLIAEGDWLTR